MTTTTDPVEEMAARLRDAKEQTGLSYKQLERAAVRLLGEDAPTHETIRAYHQGTIRAERVNDRLVLVLCRIYNRPVAEVAPHVAKRLQVVRALLDQDEPRVRWNHVHPRQMGLFDASPRTRQSDRAPVNLTDRARALRALDDAA